MSVFQPTTTDEWVRSQTKEVQRLGRRGRGATANGTTAARDNLYPPPTTLAQRVALANREVRWFNTEQGWWESYYAVTGGAGLTVRGLRATAAPGWYPMPGGGPRRRLRVASSQAMTNGTSFSNWATSGGDAAWRGNGTYDVLYAGAILRAPVAGVYDLYYRMSLQAGGGTAVMGVYRAVPSAGYLLQDPVVLQASYGTSFDGSMSIQADALSTYSIAVAAGTLTIGGGGGWFELRYVDPPWADVAVG